MYSFSGEEKKDASKDDDDDDDDDEEEDDDHHRHHRRRSKNRIHGNKSSFSEGDAASTRDEDDDDEDGDEEGEEGEEEEGEEGEEEGEEEGGGEDGVTEDAFVEEPAECCPNWCYVKFPFLAGNDESVVWQRWWTIRCATFRMIEHKYFETFIIIMILISSLALVSIKRGIRGGRILIRGSCVPDWEVVSGPIFLCQLFFYTCYHVDTHFAMNGKEASSSLGFEQRKRTY